MVKATVGLRSSGWSLLLPAAAGEWNRRMIDVSVSNSPHCYISVIPTLDDVSGSCCWRGASELLLFGVITVGSFMLNKKIPRSKDILLLSIYA